MVSLSIDKMASNDLMANALSKLKNASERGKKEVKIYPSSKTITKVLDLLKKDGYIESYENENTSKGVFTTVKLSGKINNIGVIKPRYSVKLDTYEKFEKRYLPAKDFGRIFVSTTSGIINHLEAKKQNKGGVLLAYVY